MEPEAVADDGREKFGVNMGIAIVIPAEKIIEILEQFATEEEQEAADFREKKRSVMTVGSPEQRTNTTAQITIAGISVPAPQKNR